MVLRRLGSGAVRVTAKPKDRPAFFIRLTGMPTWTDNEMGGYGDAKVPCLLTPDEIERIGDARVVIWGSLGPAYIGRVDTCEAGSLVCTGALNEMDRTPQADCFLETSLEKWQERTATARSAKMRPQVDSDNYIRIVYEEGSVLPNGAENGVMIEIPTTGGCKVQADWSRPSIATALFLCSGVDGTGLPGEPITWTERATQAWLTGPLDGSFNAEWNGTTTHLLLYAKANSGSTIPADWFSAFYNVRIFGVDGITTVNLTTITNELLDRLPADVLPAGAEYRRFVESNTQTIDRSVYPPEQTSLDKLTDLCQRVDWAFAFRARMVGNEWFALPILRTRPDPDTDAPDYIVIADPDTAAADLTAPRISNMCSAVQVKYVRPDGREMTTTVADTNRDHYLVKIGSTRIETIESDNTTLAGAQADGTAWLAKKSKHQTTGPVRCTTGIRAANGGAEVQPIEVEAGKLIMVHRAASGPVVGGGKTVEHTGNFSVTINVDNNPDLSQIIVSTGAAHLPHLGRPKIGKYPPVWGPRHRHKIHGHWGRWHRDMNPWWKTEFARLKALRKKKKKR